MRSEHRPQRARTESRTGGTPRAKTRRARRSGGGHGSPAPAAPLGGCA